jgi:Tfp pilus assembly protein PilX
MRTRLREETGFALIGALLILIILMGIGIALLSMSDNQQTQSGGQKVRESSYNLADAALNAAALQLGRNWPNAGSTVACTPSNWSTYNYCPSAATDGTTASFAEAYRSQNSPEYATACPGSPSTPLWKTQVNDNIAGEQYWTTAVSSRPTWDSNADGTVWVRAWANVQCKPSTIVALVSATQLTLAIPNTVVSANWLTTTNQGRKTIIDARGNGSAQPSKIVLRCGSGSPGNCANFNSGKGQIQPPQNVQTSSASSSSTLTATQLQALEQQAAAASCPSNTANNGTCLWTTGCPTTTAQLTSPQGAPIVVLGSAASPCNISISATANINSPTAPGALVIEYGTLTLAGSLNFYGLIYMVNKQASSGVVLSITGNAQVTGSVLIDGAGGLSAGGSKTNLVYDQRATTLLRGSTGATVNRGSVRILPPSTP